mmetsp:Transcript_41329/g.67014  ORF Transcript_41329/g.67014 Transcript_41329/m.67014 type:complete len:310 (-) Transcript_41329:165-1094(-)
MVFHMSLLSIFEAWSAVSAAASADVFARRSFALWGVTPSLWDLMRRVMAKFMTARRAKATAARGIFCTMSLNSSWISVPYGLEAVSATSRALSSHLSSSNLRTLLRPVSAAACSASNSFWKSAGFFWILSEAFLMQSTETAKAWARGADILMSLNVSKRVTSTSRGTRAHVGAKSLRMSRAMLGIFRTRETSSDMASESFCSRVPGVQVKRYEASRAAAIVSRPWDVKCSLLNFDARVGVALEMEVLIELTAGVMALLIPDDSFCFRRSTWSSILPRPPAIVSSTDRIVVVNLPQAVLTGGASALNSAT